MKKNLCRFAAPLACAAAALLLCAFTPGTATEDEALAALSTKARVVDFDHPYEELDPLDESLARYEVFLSGEGHAIQMSYQMQEYLAKYFIEKQNVRYLLMEMSYSEGELLNDYLETGDEQLLANIVDAFEGSLAYSQDTYEFYRGLREYRQSLPREKRFRLVGVDVEHQKALSARYLKTLLREDRTPDPEIAEIVGKLKNAEEYVWDPLFCRNMASSLKKHEGAYRDYFGYRFFSFSLMARNLLASTSDMTLRESAIIENFRTLYEHLPRGKYYGQFGGMHVIKGQVRYSDESPLIDTFAQSLNTGEGALRGKVYCLPIFYNNCRYLDTEGQVQENSTLDIPMLHGEEPGVLFVNPLEVPEFYDFLTAAGVERGQLGDCTYIVSNSPPVAPRQK